ncbi:MULTISPECIES: LysE family translocator [unclassified Ensifer]|uniref:LysE family translocator n=1 Tax=unclassified Ensifer TaxID=2633371 RepID=UPI000812F259|nr:MULTISPECIES: LysE family translocator [unclassified Ensifer]OCO99076.1 lysine transporter LysE [Ensifer sp. LC14]OCP11388.1 lysine transporter LysE [Ensifer sp. LC13]OCP11968.1 lysine transporter LysE [Ensifer sp. LC11]OCP33563.1 lysine transporter LysE [Ensifer sp. LC499]
MSLAVFFAYMLALFLAAVTPGPAMFAVISTSISRGVGPALACGLGIALSDMVLVSVALAGLTVIAQTFGWLFLAIKYAGAAYLIFLGYRMWRAAATVAAEATSGERGWIRSLALGAAIGFGNPKAILFHASLMPLILDLDSLDQFGIATVLAVVFAVNIVTMGGYALLSAASSRWFRTTRAMRALNRVAGSTMIATGVVIAARS